MRLFYDTETSGLPREGLPHTDPSQPRLVQLAASLYDANWKRTGAMVVLIKPDGWSIEPEAEAVHGISEARCSRHGVPLVAALALFQGFAMTARQIVAHNSEHDRRIIRTELHHVGADGAWWQRKAPAMFCTMEAGTPVTQIPGKFGGFSFPSLEALHNHFHPEMGWASRHDAEDDLQATVRCFRGLDRLGLAPAPALVGGPR